MPVFQNDAKANVDALVLTNESAAADVGACIVTLSLLNPLVAVMC